MVSQNHYRDRLKLANRIAHEGSLVNPPCGRCARMSERKTIECKRISSTEKCGNCVRAGRRCEQEFHSDKEWERLDKAREKVNIDLAITDSQLSSFEEESLRLQKESSKKQEEFLKEFLRVQESVSTLQKNISKALTKHSQLRQQKKFLDERNMKMLGHDLEILEELDEQNPPPPSPPIEGVDFSSSEGVGSNELLDPILPDFWVQLNAIVDDNSEVTVGNLSSC
jgi:chromosome segregation ATPase